MQDWDLVIHNVHLATMEHGYGELLDAAIAVKDGRIAWFGPGDELPASGAVLFDGQGCWLTPGLIDCHTHIVHAGNRSDEFEARLNGASYEDISRAGGGIMSTVRATRAASEDALLQQSLPRVLALLAEGVTTLEIKSGYGLDADSEAKMLRVARRIGRKAAGHLCAPRSWARMRFHPNMRASPTLISTCCARRCCPGSLALAWSTPSTRSASASALRRRKRNACSKRREAWDLPVKLHAEQLSDLGGAALVARYAGLSADHLEFLSAEGIAAMAEHGTVAVLLPGAYYFLRETQPPPVAALRAAGVPMAVATDCNPGTSPMTSLLLAMNMACTLWRLTPQEALAGATCHAARALGLQQETGSLVVGKRADFALWRIARPADLAYALGLNPCAGVVHGGVWRAPVVSLTD